MTHYNGKPIDALTDAELALAEQDVANCLLRAHGAPRSAPVQMGDDGKPVTDAGRYGVYFERMSALANEIAAEKGRRNG